ncbi:serine/threonine protein phosphatase [Gaiella sp.]|uniref:protein-tyrosine phosphatase family protein n=1 Tax=Gaiella sp. TaxID=2663207 RepID=UPI0032653059
MAVPPIYRVAEGLVAGGYPGTPEAIATLEGEGVSVFVDLTHPSDPLPDYGQWLAGTSRIAHPIPDMGTPTAGHMMRILDDIDETRANGGTAYVHCWGGVGRTGSVIGCWLMRHGLDDGDPVARIAELRAGLPGDRPSPETLGQTRLVRGWRRGW